MRAGSIPTGWGGGGLVVDAVIVGIDRATGRLRAFQDLSSRARGAVTEAEVSVDVCVFVFDLLFVGDAAANDADAAAAAMGERAEEGEEKRAEEGTTYPSTTTTKENEVEAVKGKIRQVHDMSLRERRAMLAAALPGLGRMPGRFEMAQSVEIEVRGGDGGGGGGTLGAAAAGEHAGASAATTGPEPSAAATATATAPPPSSSSSFSSSSSSFAAAVETVESFMLESLDAACEGLMLKRLNGPASAYSPSKRADSWLKVKRDYCEELRDSLDLVCIGAWRGNGRKAGWFSPFLLAVYDPDTEEYSSMCRCMSGFTDAFYADRTERFSSPDIVLPSRPPYYHTWENPDVWFAPTEVWEVRGADLTLSPKHLAAAGMRHRERGVSLRFPRFISHRVDKSVEDASGPAEVVALYDAQQRRFEGQGAAAAKRLKDTADVAAHAAAAAANKAAAAGAAGVDDAEDDDDADSDKDGEESEGDGGAGGMDGEDDE